MVSGIGPPETLQRLAIPVISPLRGVGQNLWVRLVDSEPARCLLADLVATGSTIFWYWVSHECDVKPTARELVLSRAKSYRFLSTPGWPVDEHWSGSDWYMSSFHLLTQDDSLPLGWEKIPAKYRKSFQRSSIEDLSQFPSDWPEIEILPTASATFPIKDEADYGSIRVAVVAPLSRGNVTIRSTNTSVSPLISPEWLSSRTDQEVAIAGIRVARDLALKAGIFVGPEVVPGLTVQTDSQILKYLKETASTIHHAVATCKISPTQRTPVVTPAMDV